jgi:hypothetical protein
LIEIKQVVQNNEEIMMKWKTENVMKGPYGAGHRKKRQVR